MLTNYDHRHPSPRRRQQIIRLVSLELATATEPGIKKNLRKRPRTVWEVGAYCMIMLMIMFIIDNVDNVDNVGDDADADADADVDAGSRRRRRIMLRTATLRMMPSMMRSRKY